MTKNTNSITRKWWPFVCALFLVMVSLFVVFTKNGEYSKLSNTEVTYRLKWLANTGFVGDIYAFTYGYFEENNLTVNLKPGGPEHNPIRELITGRAQFGVASADQVISALEDQKEKPDIVVIAQIYQNNPVQWIYRKDKYSFSKPSDLVNHIVGVTVGDNDETIMKAVLEKASLNYPDSFRSKKDKIDPNNKTVILYPVRYDYTPFLTKTVEFFPVYRNTQGIDLKIQLKSAKEETAFFDPDLHGGIKFVANSIITSGRLLRENPELVNAFLDAVIRGWNNSLDPANEDQAIKALKQYVKPSADETEIDLENRLREQIKATRKLVIPARDTILGKIDLDAWKRTEEIMLKYKIIKHPVYIFNYLKLDFISNLNSADE